MGRAFGVQMRYRRSDADYGTAGSVRYALDLLDERVLIVSGDVLTDIDLGAAVRFHESAARPSPWCWCMSPTPRSSAW